MSQYELIKRDHTYIKEFTEDHVQNMSSASAETTNPQLWNKWSLDGHFHNVCFMIECADTFYIPGVLTWAMVSQYTVRHSVMYVYRFILICNHRNKQTILMCDDNFILLNVWFSFRYHISDFSKIYFPQRLINKRNDTRV